MRKVRSQMGSYQIFGVTVPDIGELASGAKSGAMNTVATGAATSPSVIAAGKTAIGNSLGNKIIDFYTQKPVIAIASTLAVVGAIMYLGGFIGKLKKM
jgi:hypothetical protein